ncbi:MULTISPECIES: hypothetical protein [unclassified Novosphingobium]|uniref:hypothetical protein n=1 Tax=unclassified Novosphingobium TaxID=2644732 RepID=UPI001441C2BA|nr:MULTISPECIES: hypothetical protein [unclassified Novosphingobium]MBB3359242.1 flagellar biosynthesis protein FlhB [Novosphingobium sp. BK256]MBB3375277.1 flagellar biosynthesis protein FlhB [Novosphingobium sp. BK280]MBB3380015.1 flagellar biosynthesis protein FlhB [Novosphingobium sp. BK258]MBB3421709.1 flagellar biosynthesis protein FlhB [Novosphingobium sp. BK267]MBB3450024.1 flagellar biosynthesis protein FlhB [Novosphingobium sp. BK352]
MTKPLIAPLDSMAAWQGATRIVSANADLLIAIAGVFFLLPLLVGAIFIAPPVIPPQVTQQQLAQVMQDYYTRNLPYLLPLSLFQIVGFITMLVCVLDRSRPTVGQALRNCAARVPAYFLAQVLIGLFALLLMMVVSGVLLGLRVPAPLAAGAGLAAVVYPLLRTIMVGPVLGVGRTHNPIMAIRASVALTRGNTARILAFLGLAMVVFLVAMSVVMMVVGLITTQLLGAENESARLINEAISALLYSVGYTYFVAMLAGIHGQLTADLPRPFL